MALEKQLYTTKYPTRYAAFKSPRTWVEHANPEHRGGFEYAVYSDRMKNVDYPHLEDGIYIEIVSYQGIDYLLSCHATRPKKGREQLNFVQRYPEYHLAKTAALKWLPKAYSFCSKRETEALLAEIKEKRQPAQRGEVPFQEFPGRET